MSQNIEEEVDFQASGSAGGQNYGWRVLEGNLCFNPSTCTAPPGYVAPVAIYDHGANDSYGCSVTGGYVYRGAQWPAPQGVYFYGDFCSGKVFGLVRNPSNSWDYGIVASTNFRISSFGQDENGELYLADYSTGIIYRISYPCAGTIVDVMIGASPVASSCVPAASTIQSSYFGVQNGPAEVRSQNSVVTSERGLFGPFHTFNEVLGYRNNQLTNHYWFPWYDNRDMITWVLVGNPSATQTAHVTITIAGTSYGLCAVPPFGKITPTYTGLLTGPVHVTSDIPVFTSQRAMAGYPGTAPSFNEMMGMANNKLTNDYWFTWHDDKDKNTSIAVGKP